MPLVWLWALVCMRELGSPFGVSKLIINCLTCVCVRLIECVLPVRVEANTEVDCLLNSNQRDVALQFSFG